MTQRRDHDLVLYGASGFVGRLTAQHLAAHAPGGTRIALAGRSRERIAAVRDALDDRASEWPLLVADVSDPSALARIAASTTALVTTVGPYASYGLPVVEACAAAGTHYADLTGETTFVREAIDRHDATARRTGARIVVSAGFDSIPSDIGVLALHEAVAAAGDGELEDTTLVVTAMRGGFSGGTFASIAGVVESAVRDPRVRRLLADPYSLSPDREAEPDLGRQLDVVPPSWDRGLGRWVAPFVMASHNNRIVRRSNALTGWSYGRRFRYREVMGFPGRRGLAKAVGVSAGVGALVGTMSLRPTRTLLTRALPSPGEGPSEQARNNGRFAVEIHTRTSSGSRWVATVAASGDPGYQATSVMLGQTSLALAVDAGSLPDMAGVLTPATGLGTALADRLRAQAFTIETRRA